MPGAALLRWMWTSPGQPAEWIVGCQDASGLIGLVTAAPARVRIEGTVHTLARVNFLCLHQRHRGHRLARTLVLEITRRIVAAGIYAALFMGPGLSGFRGRIARVPSMWRPLHPFRVLDAGLIRRPARFALRPAPAESRLRPLRPSDLPAVQSFLSAQVADARFCPVPESAALAHWLLPRPGVVDSHVVEEGGEILELTSVSFSRMAIQDRHRQLAVASGVVHRSRIRPLSALLEDTLVLARQAGGELFELILVGPYGRVLAPDTRYLQGPTPMSYHLFNEECPQLEAADIGWVLPL